MIKKLLLGFLLSCFIVISAHADDYGFAVGKDLSSETLYLCQGKYQNSIQPGKTWRNAKKCNIPFAGKEIGLTKFNLYPKQPTGYWQTIYQPHIPKNALQVGTDINGKKLYLCRAFVDASWQPGKTWRGNGHCNVAFRGSEKRALNYWIYVTSTKAKADTMNAPKAPAPYQCVTSASGKKLCGYDCKVTAEDAGCAEKSNQQCMRDSWGHVACGYNCTNSLMHVKCADSQKKTCMANQLGFIRCGYNCHKGFLGLVYCSDEPLNIRT